jgi:two-component system, LytTR family, response regulator LytT
LSPAAAGGAPRTAGTANTPLRTLVVEDEWPARNYLVELLEASGLAEVVGAVPGVEEAREAIKGGPAGAGIEAMFVDVQLLGAESQENGLELVRSIVGEPGAPMIVLATAFERHAIEAFELGVVDYLLKPFTEERIKQCLRRLHERRQGAQPASTGALRIVARRKRSLVFLEPHEIWAFEAADRLTCVHTEHGVFDLDLSLTAIEASFGRAFTRVHRRWLVNASYIKELERDGNETRLFVGPAIGDGTRGVRVPVARERASSVREALLSNATGLRRA